MKGLIPKMLGSVGIQIFGYLHSSHQELVMRRNTESIEFPLHVPKNQPSSIFHIFSTAEFLLLILHVTTLKHRKVSLKSQWKGRHDNLAILTSYFQISIILFVYLPPLEFTDQPLSSFELLLPHNWLQKDGTQFGILNSNTHFPQDTLFLD